MKKIKNFLQTFKKSEDTKNDFEIVLKSKIYPTDQIDYDSPLSPDCWTLICLWLDDDFSSIFNLLITHKSTGSLLYSDYFWQRLCYPEEKEPNQSWKEFFLVSKNLNFPHQLFAKGSRQELEKTKLRGIFAKLKGKDTENIIETCKIALLSNNDLWYSISGSVADNKALLFLGAEPVLFSKSPTNYFTLVSGNSSPWIYDFGIYRIFPTHIVWYCDYIPSRWLMDPTVHAYDEKNNCLVLLASKKNIQETVSECVIVLHCQKVDFPIRYLVLNQGEGSYTLISGMEIFGRVRKTKSKLENFFFAKSAILDKENKFNCYVQKKVHPLYEHADQNMLLRITQMWFEQTKNKLNK